MPCDGPGALALACQVLASTLSLLSIYLMGNKSVTGPIVGLVAQVFWIGHVVLTPAWGIAPVPIALSIIQIRNLRKWLHEAKLDKITQCGV